MMRLLAPISTPAKSNVARLKNRRLIFKPRLDEVAKIWEEIAGSVDEHYRAEIFRSRPDDTESDSAYCQDNDRVGDSVERAPTLPLA